MSQKTVACLIFYNLKKPELKIIVVGVQYPDIYNFTSNLMLTYFTSQFFMLAEMSYFYTSLLC